MLTKSLFDVYNGKDIYLYTLSNNQLKVGITDFGAAIQFLKVKTKAGDTDVCLGYNTIEDRLESVSYCGATIGRVANRIGNARFNLNGKEYRLSVNDGKNQNHGGRGFSERLWQAEIVGDVLKLTIESADGDEGFPHKLNMTVEYELVENRLEIRYSATADGDTVWAPTNHAYFNLDGENSKNIYDIKLKINADEFTLLDAEHISTGEIVSVKGTPFDFTEFKTIGAEINTENKQLIMAQGYDCNFILNNELAAIVKSERSRIQLSVYTDMPGLQLYTGNYLCGKGRTGEYVKRQGFCLEAQYFPNAVNIPNFETPLLKMGEIKKHYIYYKFDLL